MSVTQVIPCNTDPSLKLFRMDSGHAMIADERSYAYRYYTPNGKPLHPDSKIAQAIGNAAIEWELTHSL